jgi:hypothetical protein
MFTGEITYVSEFLKSRKEGFYRLVVIKTLAGELEKGKVYLNPENRNYRKWEPVLRAGTILKNLVWKDISTGTIDGDSPIEAV